MKVFLATVAIVLTSSTLWAQTQQEPFGVGLYGRQVPMAFPSGDGKVTPLEDDGRGAFDGQADYETSVFGLHYFISGGKFVNGQTVNGDNASGGVFRFISDDPNWGSYPLQVWNRDDWFTQNAGLALTLENGGTIVYDNNGIETHTTGGYYDDTQTSIAGLYMGFCMSNNYDWIYAGYFKLEAPTQIDTIIGYFDGTGYYGYFDPSNPAIAYRMNIFSSYMDGIHPMPTNTGAFDGDVLCTDTTSGTFSWSDTGEARRYSGWGDRTDPIYRLVYTLDTPITLPPGEYFFSHDVFFPTPPEVHVDDDWAGLSNGDIVTVDTVDYTIGHDAFASIQPGVDAVAVGGYVFVHEGLYNENITVNKHVHIIGSGSGADPVADTIITQNTAGAGDTKIGVVQLTASGVSETSPILVQDLRVEPDGMAGISVGRFTEATGTNVSYVELDNVRVIGNNANPSTEQERGLYVDLTSTLSYLTVRNCAFDNLTYGWYLQKEVSADASTVGPVTVTGTSFNHNNLKGFYAEKLTDATFSTCQARENGFSSAGVPSYFLPWMSGFDINLKAGTYQNLTFECCIITDNALGGARDGVGLTVKGRGTGTNPSGSYTGFPAYVSDVSILGGTVTGNERGIRLGEPGKGNDGPTNVAIHNVNLYGNVQTYAGGDGSAYGDLVDVRGTGADLIDATMNWWGQVGGPVAGQVASVELPDPDTSDPLDAEYTECGLPNALSLYVDGECYAAGDQVTVDVVLNGNTAEVLGGLFFLSYSDTLSFVSIEPGDAPFTVEEVETVDTGTREISYTVGVPTNTPPQGYTGAGSIIMARMTFDVIGEECNLEDAVAWRTPAFPFQTRLSQLVNGMALPLIPNDLGTMDDIAIDFTAPIITCPPDILADADPGECQRTFNYEEPFDDPVCIASTQTPDCWYTDRFPPRVFESAAFDGDNRLYVQIHADDFQGYGNFYATQGRKYDLDMPAGTILAADLHIPADWQTDVRSCGMWATTFDSNHNISGYPIITFSSNDPADPANTAPANPTPRFMYYTQDTDQDPTNGYQAGYVDLFTPTQFGVWYRLEIELTNDSYIFRILDAGGLELASATDVITFGSLRFGNIIIQGYNFGETYDIHWDNITLGPEGPIVEENCGDYVNATLTYERSDALLLEDPYAVGTTTITWTATDCAGNATSCDQTVTIEDNENPVITGCPTDITQTNDAGDCGAVVTWVNPIASDNCGIQSFTSTDAPGDFFPVGTTTVTYTAIDIYGNTSTCVFDVTVTDNENPTITCPANITQTADAGYCSAAVCVPSPATADNCGVAGVVNNYNGTADASDVYPVGTTPVVWTVTDIYGNTAQCSMTITITDDEDPTITCPADITVSNDAGACGANVTVPAPAYGDNCPGATIVNDYNSTANASDYYAVGTHTVIWTVSDAAGNSATCSMTITVNDTEAPVISGCPGNIMVQAEAGGCDAVVSWTEPTATDNCGMQSFTSTHSPGDTFGQGTTTVTYTAQDIHGNTSTCSFDVTVTGANDLVVDIQIQGSLSDDVTRCITFAFYDCADPTTPVVVPREINFAYATGLGHAEFTFANGDGIPCGNYTCVLVQDDLHTLTRKLELGGAAFYTAGGQYLIDCTDATGNLLLQGDLYDDTADLGVDIIDVVDIGVYIAEWGAVYDSNGDTTPDGHTPCGVFTVHADSSGDGVLDLSDRAFITTNYQLFGEYNCCSLRSGMGLQPQPRLTITADELCAMGLDFVAERADLNHDGILDTTDIRLFDKGVRPGNDASMDHTSSSLLDLLDANALREQGVMRR